MTLSSTTKSFILKAMLRECLNLRNQQVDYAEHLVALFEVCADQYPEVMESLRGSFFWGEWQLIYLDPESILEQRKTVNEKIFAALVELLIKQDKLVLAGLSTVDTVIMFNDYAGKPEYTILDSRTDVEEWEINTTVAQEKPLLVLQYAFTASDSFAAGRRFGK